MRLLWVLVLIFAISGCNEEAPNMDQLELLELIKSLESDIEVLVPPSLNKPLVYCYKYLPPCKLGYKVKIKGLEVTALYYEEKKSAKESAKSLKGYQFRNWAFDDVKGEPILERFFENELGAQKRF